MHTYSEWKVARKENGNLRITIHGIDESQGAETLFPIGELYKHPHDQEIADLITAAPKLLEALKEAQSFIGKLTYTKTPCPPDLWEKMKSAIAKVKEK